MMIINKYKLQMINNINKIIKFIRIILIIIKLCNIEEILKNIFNEILFIYNEDNANLEKKEYDNEINKNVWMIKFIGAVSVICLLKLSQEQSGYVIISFILVEILEQLVKK